MGVIVVSEMGGREIAEEVVVGTLLKMGRSTTALLSSLVFSSVGGNNIVAERESGRAIVRALLRSLSHKGMVRYYSGGDQWAPTEKAAKWANM